MAASSAWSFLECRPSQLCLNTVLVCGQSFRWKQNVLGEWLGVISGHVWRLKQTDDKIFYQVHGPGESMREGLSAAAVNGSAQQKSVGERAVTGPKLLSEQYSLVKTEENCTAKFSSLDRPRAGKKIKLEKDLCNGEASKLESESNRPTNGNLRKRNNASYCSTEANYTGIASQKPVKLERFSSAVARDARDTSEIHPNFSKILHDYFQLDLDLDGMYKHWSSRDPHFERVAGQFRGIRMLRQDPVENLLSFVCSSNNHISRISSMVEKLCTHYGEFIATVDGEPYYGFPSLSALCGDDVESHLRELGFGYRAKFISSIAKHVTQEKGGDDWVRSLRGKSYPEAKAELMSLLGVGAKVADCVCLMSLDHPGAIPVDTHVWQITLKHYLAKLNTAKSLTDKIYNEIGEFYRDLWGPYAGWAHSVLFTADLRHNKERAAKVETDKKVDTGQKKKAAAATRKRQAGNSDNSADISDIGNQTVKRKLKVEAETKPKGEATQTKGRLPRSRREK